MKSKIILLLGAFLLSLGIAEVLCRLIEHQQIRPSVRPSGWAIIPEKSWIEYHPTLGWFHQKNKESFFQKNSLTINVTTNSQGLRGKREYTIPKPSNFFRVLAIGDSFTFGFGVQNEETYPAAMEAHQPGLEVLNMGVASYGVDQITLLYPEIGKKFQPDFVLLSLYPEGFWRSLRAFTDGGYGKPYYVLDSNQKLHLRHVPVPKNRDFETPQFPKVLECNSFQRVFHSSALFRFLNKAKMRLLKQLGSEDPDSSPEWILGRAILKQTLDQIKSENIPVALVLIPPQRWITGTDEPLRKSLERFSRREGIDLIDLTPLFQKAAAEKGVETFYIRDDLHWTAKGHQLVATTLLEYLQKKGVAPLLFEQAKRVEKDNELFSTSSNSRTIMST